MKRHHALVLLCLVGLSATVSCATVQTVYIETNSNLELGKEESDNYDIDIKGCDLTLTNGTKVTLHPSNGYRDNRYSVRTYDGCFINIYRLTKNDSGIWEVQSTFKKSGKNNPIEINKYTYNVKVREMYEKKSIYPASKASAYPDQQVSVHFNEKFDNLSSCKILTPQQIEYDLAADTSANIKLSGHCGFKMIVKKEYSGEWTLIADLKNDTSFYNTFEVVVKDPQDLQPNSTNLIFKRGDEVVIQGGRQMDKAKLCILETPNGVKLPLTEGPCRHTINPVTEHHEGIWKAYYGIDGIEKLVEQDIIVKTYEASSFNTSVSHSRNGDINLLCRVQSREMKFCSFIKPDGEILHMTNAVGNEKYEYYGEGKLIDNTLMNDCGITIHNPMNSDYGSWRCLVSISSVKTVGSILKVTPPARSGIAIKLITKAENVYAKRGESFKVKCRTDEVLSYCWFRSPNGTMHTVQISEKRDKKDVNPPNLVYAGEGFDLGDCTALVPEANEYDAGRWTCHMGVANGPEIETSFSVILKDTHLIADQDVVVFESSSDPDLIFRPLPGSNKVIEACRWVNPLGHGINIDPQGRYLTETYSTHCRLSIRVINYEEDMGKWTCFARFIASQEEGQASSLLTYKGNNIGTFLGIGLVIGILICTTVGLLIFVIYKRKLAAARRLDEKIIIEKSPTGYP